MKEYRGHEISIFRCTTPYKGLIDMNVGDSLRLYVHRDVNGTPIFAWASRMDSAVKRLRHIIFVDCLSSTQPLVNDWTDMTDCCELVNDAPGYIEVYPFTVYRSIRNEVNSSKLRVMLPMIREE